jgi:hypothetical protein
MCLLKTSAVALLFLIVSASVLFAQTATGEVSGTITDPNGAAVPGAVVRLTNRATKIDSVARANESGYFIFVNVKPASYTLSVEVAGFKGTQTQLEVGVNETVTQNITLTIGQVSEAVEVLAGTEMVQRSSSDLGTVIPEKAVQDLPLNGRNFTQLLTLTPGATPVSTSQNRNVGGVEGNVGIPGAVHTIATWLNPCAFGIPSGAFGDLPRNTFRGPAVYTVDLSMFKSIAVNERFKVQLRAEAFNVFNIINWDTPANANLTLNSNATAIAPNVARITGLAQGTTPRQLQFGLRLVF